jgi:hypothetical protein
VRMAFLSGLPGQCFLIGGSATAHHDFVAEFDEFGTDGGADYAGAEDGYFHGILYFSFTLLQKYPVTIFIASTVYFNSMLSKMTELLKIRPL